MRETQRGRDFTRAKRDETYTAELISFTQTQKWCKKVAGTCNSIEPRLSHAADRDTHEGHNKVQDHVGGSVGAYERGSQWTPAHIHTSLSTAGYDTISLLFYCTD